MKHTMLFSRTPKSLIVEFKSFYSVAITVPNSERVPSLAVDPCG